MSPKSLAISEDYLASVRGLRELHALIARGQDESIEGEALRESLEEPWYRLTETEKERVNHLSHDLYSLTNPPYSTREMNPQAEQKLGEVLLAMEQGDWDLALDLLRRWGQFLSPASLAATRGRIWLGAGDADTALLFLARALELDPFNTESLQAYLSAVSLSQLMAVPSIVEDILNRAQEFPPQIVIQAVDVLFFKTEAGSPIEDREFLDRVIRILQNAIHRLPQNGVRQAGGLLMATGMLGVAQSRLGHTAEAMKCFGEFLTLDPQNDIAYVYRAMLQLDSNRPAAIEDARKAVHYNSANFQPYLILIFDAITSRRFEEVVGLCDRALDLDLPDDVRSAILEGEAIALAELKKPDSEVRATFERAQKLIPDDHRIRRNFEQFDRYRIDSTQINWEIPPMTDLIRSRPPIRLAA